MSNLLFTACQKNTHKWDKPINSPSGLLKTKLAKSELFAAKSDPNTMQTSEPALFTVGENFTPWCEYVRPKYENAESGTSVELLSFFFVQEQCGTSLFSNNSSQVQLGQSFCWPTCDLPSIFCF